MQDEASKAARRPGFGVFEHLAVTGRVAKAVRPAPDHQVNAFWLAGVVVVEQQLGFLVRNGLPSLS
jgi:hypothetical protein